jgi:hypothetical protein
MVSGVVSAEWAKVTATTADVCRRFKLSDAAAALRRDGLSPRQFLDLLVQAQHFPDAVRFLAHALPKREAVWWACQCARLTSGPGAPEKLAALEAAEKWAIEPTEEHRRACLPAAEAADFGTPAGCAAIAAFWSGGSLAPPDLPAVPPKDELAPGAVANAILLAAVATESEKAPETYTRFLALGANVAAGTTAWQ